MATKQEPEKRSWVTPVLVLAAFALIFFAVFYSIDFFLGDKGAGEGPFQRYVNFDADHITDAMSALAGMTAAVLGIVITVVSIIVQLSADRYTGVSRMFFRDRINIGVMVYFVIACAFGVWLSMSIHQHFVPRIATLVMIVATTVGLVLMLPYFGYVFWFLEPANIIARIRRDAVRIVHKGTRADSEQLLLEAQVPTVTAMEELTDITSNSISGKDKIIASRAVDALRDFALEYLAVKSQAKPRWFQIGERLRENPDFVAMDPESLDDLEERKTWVEWKVLRQYLGIYNESMTVMPDINYLIAIDTRYIGEEAGRHGDDDLMELVFRYMNSYLRATLNARQVRTAYNVLNQYRLLVEAMIRLQHDEVALQGVKYMNYYGQVSFDMGVTFVTETAAYDIAAACQYAHERKSPEQDAMLALFLELDQPLRVKKQEKALTGVRKAQVKLAAYYLAAGAEDKARLIADDMKDEPQVRLMAIRDQLSRVESKDFWEIIDRGRNFEYMPPKQRACMATFFEWLKVPDPADSAEAAAN